MTLLSHAQLGVVPPLAPSSSSGPVGGAGLGHRLDTDWSRRSDVEQTNRKQRRAALAKAKAAVESRPAETKAERLARSSSDRDTGSEAERRETRASVAKAMAEMADVPLDTDVQDPEFRF